MKPAHERVEQLNTMFGEFDSVRKKLERAAENGKITIIYPDEADALCKALEMYEQENKKMSKRIERLSP